ncbi:MAG: sporulation protein, partial [Polyangiaceae bacterium]
MGLLDSMFGGGTRLELTLDTQTASPGSVIGGRIVLFGGQKPLTITECGVRLLFVSTKMRPGSSLPEIDARDVAKQIVAGGIALMPGSQQVYTFRLTVPDDLPPSGTGISFTVLAFADIPGIKDPSSSIEIRVLEASKDKGRRIPLDQVVSRFPNLRSQDEDSLCDALYEFFLACYSEGGELMEAEPLVSWHMQNGTVKVRRKALEAWANLVDNRVQPQHLQTLYAFA